MIEDEEPDTKSRNSPYKHLCRIVNVLIFGRMNTYSLPGIKIETNFSFPKMIIFLENE